MHKEEKTLSLESFGYRQELKRALTHQDLIIYGLIFMVPIAPFGIYGILSQVSGGMVALVYLVAAVGMLFTGFSYWRLAEVFPITGSVYAYTSRGINQNVGFMAGWMIALDYLLLPSLLYVVSASALNTIVPVIPIWTWITLFVLINTFVSMRGITLTAQVNKVILLFELLVLAVFIVSAIMTVHSNGQMAFSLKPLFNKETFDLGFIMQGVSIAILSFIGFDGISALAEETKDGASSVGKSCIWAIIIAGGLFVLQTFVAGTLWPAGKPFTNVDDAFYDVAFIAGGQQLVLICAVATGFAWGIANAMAAQTTISRVIYSMARDGFLPRHLAFIHPKYQTPYVANLLIASITLAITLFFSSSISVLSTLINFGALTGFMVINSTVIYYFMYKKKSKHYVKHLVMPLMGLGIVVYAWVHLNLMAILIGACWLFIGMIILFVMKYVFKRDADLEI